MKALAENAHLKHETDMNKTVLELHQKNLRWSYMGKVESYNSDGFDGCQGEDCLYSFERLQDETTQTLERLQDETAETWWTANEQYVNTLLLQASWVKAHFFETFQTVAEVLNAASSVADISRQFTSISEEEFALPLDHRSYKRLHDPTANVTATRCNVKFGPLKTKDRAMDKVRTMWERKRAGGAAWLCAVLPTGRWVVAVLRLTMSFADPYILSIAWRAVFSLTNIVVLRVPEFPSSMKLSAHRTLGLCSGADSALARRCVLFGDRRQTKYG